MLDFQQKRKLRSALYNKVTLVILGIVVIFALRSVWQVFEKQRESEALRANAAERVAALQDRDTELQSEIDRMSTPQGVEAEIRSKFSVAKGGENIVVIEDDAIATSSTPIHHSWWYSLTHLFQK